MDGISVSVGSQGLSNVDKGGPQHAYALILKHNAPGIIRFLTDEMKVKAKQCGFEMNARSEVMEETSDNIH
ncbi:hypothetical protein IEQ63_000135 [Salmonella enterica]|nr:hypothetical protein [Salmonella enterica]